MHFSRAFDFISEITVVSNDDRWACDCDLWPDVAWFHRMALYGKVDGIVWDVLHCPWHGLVWFYGSPGNESLPKLIYALYCLSNGFLPTILL